MKAFILSLCLLAACAAAASAVADRKAKAHPDFTGTWKLDKAKSDFGAFGDRPLARAGSTLVVEHKDPELKIRRTLSLDGREEVKEFAYYTDGRGETNQATIGVGAVTSKTTWVGDRVVAEASIERRGQGGPYKLNVTQKWQVNSDRDGLVHTTIISNETGAEQLNLFYRRAQP